MKALLTILSVIFITACSDIDMGGYTESILKNTNAPDISSLSKINQQGSLKKESSPLDEDLSGLDEDERRKKLINTYPWPLAKNGTDADITISGMYAIPYNPNDGSILAYEWKNINPSFAERSNGHAFGFDRDPTDRDPIVYISTETGKEVAFDFKYEKNTFNNYYLLSNKEKIADIVNKRPITLGYNTLSGDAATYTLYGCLDKKANRRAPTCYNTQKQVKIIPYDLQKKHFVYIELNGNNWNPEDYNNSFTKQIVIEKFNEVYKQAVINVDDNSVISIPANDFGINTNKIKEYFEREDVKAEYGSLDINNYLKNGLLVVNMTNPEANAPLFSALFEIADDNRRGITSDTYNDDGTVNKESPYWHIVYAINRIRKEWHLNKCKGEHESLISCPTFNPYNEPENPTVQYHRYNKKTKKDEDVDVKTVRVKKGTVEKLGFAIFINGTMQRLDDDDILYTENGLPVVPSASGVSGGQSAVSTFYTDEDMHDNYLPYGSIIFTPRQNGESGAYILMHELGHSFGLTDVAQSDIYMIKESSKIEIKEIPYQNPYASAETNLMSWSKPNGKKLRYRPTQIVCTGGTKYYTDANTLKGVVEREIENGEEHQWDCLRGECYNSNDPKKKYSSDQRIEFWTKLNRCKEESKPTTEKTAKRRLTDEATYKKDKEAKMKEKIINYNIEYTEKEKDELRL